MHRNVDNYLDPGVNHWPRLDDVDDVDGALVPAGRPLTSDVPRSVFVRRRRSVPSAPLPLAPPESDCIFL